MANEVLAVDVNGNPVGGAISSLNGEIRQLRVDETTKALEVKLTSPGAVTQQGSWRVEVCSLPPLPTGGNLIGFVGVNSLPSLPTGNNYIGRVGIQSLPALSAGNNVIGKVAQSGTWAVDVTSMPPINVTIPPMNLTDPLPAGSNTIGKVDINGSVPVTGTFWQEVQPVSLTSLPALPTGTNTIGNVGIVGTVPVSGTFWQSVQPISATSLPLPSNAAQETGGNLATIAARTPALGQATKVNSTPVVLASDHSPIPVTGTFWQATQPVSIASLPALPAGSNNIGNVGVIGTVSVSGTFWQPVQPVSSTQLPAGLGQTTMVNSLPVVIASNQSAIPVTGTFWQATQPVSAASLPLPTGAATETTLAAVNTKLAGTIATSDTHTGSTSYLAVRLTDGTNFYTANSSGSTVQGTYNTTPPTLTNGQTSGLQMDSQGNLKITGSVSSVGTKTPADAYTNPTDASNQLAFNMGWNGTTWDRLKSTTANGLVVDVSRVQGTVAVTGTFWQATQPVSLASLPPLPTGSNTIGNVNVNGTVPVSGTFWQATQPVSIAALPSLASGSNIIGKVKISDGTNQIIVKAASTAPVAADPALVVAISPNSPAHPVSISDPVAVTGTFWQDTQPISAAALPLPTGAATETTLSALNTKIPAQGQALMAASTPVVIASDQSVVPVSGTFWQATQPVSAASLPLPTGAATENTLAALNTKIPALGQAAMAASTPVVIASNQSAIPVSGTFWQATQPVSLASLPALPTGTNTIGSVKLTDGTNVPAVKAASTSPAATDPAIVVAISPNSPSHPVQSYMDPTVGALLTNVTTNSTGPTVTCSHAYKTFAFKLTNTGSATITLYASADNSIYVPVATFKLDDTNTPSDGLTTGATGHTKFYAVVSGISGSPTLNGSVVGVF
jgi:hypothetical protein